MNIETRKTMPLTAEQYVRLKGGGYEEEIIEGKKYLMLPDVVFKRELKLGPIGKKARAKGKSKAKARR
jgi:hypothetical protein